MAWFLPRRAITIAYVRSGIERRATVSVWVLLAGFAAVMTLPLLIAFGAVWKANADVQGLYARHRALEIETANYRAAIDGLIGQMGSRLTTILDSGVETTRASESAPRDPIAGTSDTRSSPAPLPPLVSAADSEPGLASVATDVPIAGADAAASEPPLPAPVVESPPAAVAPVSPAPIAGERGADTEPAGRDAVKEALARVGRTRASAEAAEAPALASRTYREAVTLELEAEELSTAGRLSEARVRAVEADARFRVAEIEARAHSAEWERGALGDASSVPERSVPADTREAPAEPAESSRGESRQRPRPPASPTADVEDTVREVIAQYVNGLESRNLAALKRVWPSLGGSQERAIQTEFENARSVYALFTDPRITINGDTSTVTGSRMYSLVTHDGQRLSSVTSTKMTLRRIGDAWVIERVEHQQ